MKAWNSTLNRGTSNLKRTPLKRGTSQLKRSRLKRGRRKARYTIEQRQQMVDELVADRGHKCERCGCRIINPTRFNDHHVIPKRKPYNGPDDLWNRKLLCSSAGRDMLALMRGDVDELLDEPTQGCHEWVESHPEEARKEGFLCPKGYRYTKEENPHD